MSLRSIISTKRTILEILEPEEAEFMLQYYLENRSHLSLWEPERDSTFYTLDHWQSLIQKNNNVYKEGVGINFSVFNSSRTEIIGVCNFSNIVHGVFHACHLGFSIAEKYQGQGLMPEILNAGLQHVFEDVGLHRVMANYIPRNMRSKKLLEQLGFEKEGLARSYLKIAGQWEDHVLTSKINDA